MKLKRNHKVKSRLKFFNKKWWIHMDKNTIKKPQMSITNLLMFFEYCERKCEIPKIYRRR